MKKIKSLFQRNYEGDHLVRNEVVPGSEWVINGEGVATRKRDGTCCMIENGKLFKRYDAKNGKIPPDGFIPAQEPDPTTGHWPGWLPVGDGPEDARHREAIENRFIDVLGDSAIDVLDDGTYELCGPKVGGNPENFSVHVLIKHGGEHLLGCPRDFDGIKEYLRTRDVEGIVWHHTDGRMVKIKKKDFFKTGRGT